MHIVPYDNIVSSLVVRSLDKNHKVLDHRPVQQDVYMIKVSDYSTVQQDVYMIKVSDHLNIDQYNKMYI